MEEHKFFPVNPQKDSRQLSVINKSCPTNQYIFSHWFHYSQVFTSEPKYCELPLMFYLSASLLKEKMPTYMTLAKMAAD